VGWLSIACFALAAAFLSEFILGIVKSRKARASEQARSRLRRWATRIEPHEGDVSILRDERRDLGRSIERAPLFHNAALLLYRAHVFVPLWRFALGAMAGAGLAGFITLQLLLRYDAALLAATAAFLLPWLVVLVRKRARMQTFEVQLPEALDLIGRALRAGHALSTGLRMVADELDDPVAGEFGHMADEIALGLEARDALENMCHRIDVPDLEFFATAILIQRETGGNLAEIMDRLGNVIRERHSFYGKVNAMTAQNRGAALILLCTPPVFVVLMNLASPGFIEPLWTTSMGQSLGWTVLGMTLVGYALARRLAVVRA
jgi:tight adherence protein B